MERLRVFSFRPIACRQALSFATLLLVPGRDWILKAGVWWGSPGCLEARRALVTLSGPCSDTLHSNSLRELIPAPSSIRQAAHSSLNLPSPDLGECAPAGFVWCPLDSDYLMNPLIFSHFWQSCGFLGQGYVSGSRHLQILCHLVLIIDIQAFSSCVNWAHYVKALQTLKPNFYSYNCWP